MKLKLEELNDRTFTDRNRNGSRRSSFFEEEKSYLKPLPAHSYEPAIWIPSMKVGYDYLVSDGLNKYSVPFDLIGERVDIRTTRNAVEVFYRGNRVALHVRSHTAQRDPIVNPEHMTPEHRKYLNYNTEDFLLWASAVGAKTTQVVKYFLNSGKEAEQGFKACVSLNKMVEKYGKEKIEEACGKVLLYTSTPSIRIITTVLKSAPDKQTKHTDKLDYSICVL